MTEQQIINELDSIISYCDVTKEKAEGLRKKLSRLYEPKRRPAISNEEMARVLAGRRNFLNKKKAAQTA